MHLDVAEVDLTSHTHVDAVSVQSYVQSDDFSSCTRHAAAVSLQSSPIAENNCIISLSYGSCAQMTFFFDYSRGLVESQFLD